VEQVAVNDGGRQYDCSLAPTTAEQIAHFDALPRRQQDRARIDRFAEVARELSKTDLWELEIGATIVFFRKQGHDWADATIVR
jgi:hypothetical protein